MKNLWREISMMSPKMHAKQSKTWKWVLLKRKSSWNKWLKRSTRSLKIWRNIIDQFCFESTELMIWFIDDWETSNRMWFLIKIVTSCSWETLHKAFEMLMKMKEINLLNCSINKRISIMTQMISEKHRSFQPGSLALSTSRRTQLTWMKPPLLPEEMRATPSLHLRVQTLLLNP